MAITPVSNLYKGFIFDGENSRDYGVYITDVEVFGAPKRDVEMLTIPGRNGEFALDKGHFNNIEVVYECALGADSESDFADGVSAFRNWLASKKGYKTLSDEINTGEYRKAVFYDGVEVETLNRKSGTFEVKFDCKPQRWLNSGETEINVSDGDTITNPTLFDASPLLKVDGYGTVSLDGDEIEISIEPYGTVILYNGAGTYGGNAAINLDNSKYNPGDTIAIRGNHLQGGTEISLPIYSNDVLKPITNVTITVSATIDTVTQEPYTTSAGGTGVEIVAYANTHLCAGGVYTAWNIQISAAITYNDNGTPTTENVILDYDFDYNGSNRITVTKTVTNNSTVLKNGGMIQIGEISVNSTKTAAGEIYIDLDIGEAYDIDNGTVVSVNDSVTLPAELPTLKAGANTINCDNTITSLKIVPRWWKV